MPDYLLDIKQAGAYGAATVPAGVTQALIQCWGGGGQGFYGGGGGGAWATKTVTVAPGWKFSVTVGANADGYPVPRSSAVVFEGRPELTCYAEAGENADFTGAGGAGARADDCLGDSAHSGGDGGPLQSNLSGGGGGGGARSVGDGVTATTDIGGTIGGPIGGCVDILINGVAFGSLPTKARYSGGGGGTPTGLYRTDSYSHGSAGRVRIEFS